MDDKSDDATTGRQCSNRAVHSVYMLLQVKAKEKYFPMSPLICQLRKQQHGGSGQARS